MVTSNRRFENNRAEILRQRSQKVNFLVDLIDRRNEINDPTIKLPRFTIQSQGPNRDNESERDARLSPGDFQIV